MAVLPRITALALALCFVSGSASAQEALTLDRAIQNALAHNPALTAARAGVAEAEAGISEARAAWLPRVSFTEGWQRGDQPVFAFGALLSARRFTAANFAIDQLNHPPATNLFRASFGAEQLLFDGGNRRAASQRAALERDLAQFAADDQAAALVLAATETYGRILTAEAGARAARAALDFAREDEARAGRRRDAGMASEADVLAIVAEAARLAQKEIDLQADAAVARAELNRLMGAPVDAAFRVVEPAAEVPAQGVALAEALAEADTNRLDLKRARTAVVQAELEGRRARSGFLPQVAAQAAVDFNGNRFNPNQRESSWLVGGEIRWSLSLGGAEAARSRAAGAARERARAEVEAARGRAQVEVVTAYRRLEAARARQVVGRTAVDQARERQRIVRDRFDAGLEGVDDVLRASSAVLDAEAQRVAALVDAVTSDAQLRRAIGRRP